MCQQFQTDIYFLIQRPIKKLFRGEYLKGILNLYYIKTLILVILTNIHSLIEFLGDRDCKGEKPRWLVESAYTPPETGIPEDRVYMPLNVTEYHQDMLDMLKKQELVQSDATIEEYI